MGDQTVRRDAQVRREFEEELRPHLQTLYAAAMRYTRRESDAEDLLQDAVLRAYRFYDRFEAGTNFRAWLLRILTNTFINKYRRSTRERKLFDGAEAKPVGEGVVSRTTLKQLTNPVEHAQRGLLAKEIETALAELPEDYRTIIVLADVEELAYREIATVLDCPIGTVMSRLHRARRALRAKLVGQAEALGIITPAEPDSGSEEGTREEQPVSLNAFRRRRVGGGS